MWHGGASYDLEVAVMYLCVFVDIYIESQKGAENRPFVSLSIHIISLSSAVTLASCASTLHAYATLAASHERRMRDTRHL